MKTSMGRERKVINLDESPSYSTEEVVGYETKVQDLLQKAAERTIVHDRYHETNF